MSEVVSKQDFAKLVGVNKSAVSNWIARGHLSGAALVGKGLRARIDVEAAKEQLRDNLDPSQIGGTQTAKLDEPVPVKASAAPTPSASIPTSGRTIESHIKVARLRQLNLSNEKAKLEAAVVAGKYVSADDARQSAGRIAGQLMATFESAIVEFSNSIAAQSDLSSRDAARLLKGVWRAIRQREAKVVRAEVQGMPAVVNDDGKAG